MAADALVEAGKLGIFTPSLLVHARKPPDDPPTVAPWADLEMARSKQAAKFPLSTRTRCPLPAFPDGWYFVALSRDLQPGTLLGRQWMGQPIVAWRDQDAAVCVAGAYCPHLGARLSPETGGRLKDGRLVCPFHGFEYDASGHLRRDTERAPAALLQA